MKKGQFDPAGDCICEQCGKNFHIWPSRVKAGRGKYCSRNCLKLATKKVTKNCLECKEKFTLLACTDKVNNRKFCSKKCDASWKSINIREEKTSSWKGGRPKCLDCGSQLVGYSSKYCRKCMNKGERNHFWKGGITPERERLRHSQESRKWAIAVKRRDNFTCQMCGNQAKELHADHILSWAEFPELRFDIDNGRTLCRACHYLVTIGKPLPEGNRWALYSSQ